MNAIVYQEELLFPVLLRDLPQNVIQISASLGIGLQYDKNGKVRYTVRGKKSFLVTTDGLVAFNVKGRSDVDQEFKQVSFVTSWHFMKILMK